MIRSVLPFALLFTAPTLFAQRVSTPQELVVVQSGSHAVAFTPTAGQAAGREQPQVWLGLSLRAREDGAPRLEIVESLPDSPAQAADLRAGDKLVAIAGQQVPRYENLLKVLGERKAGQKIHVTVERSVSVTLGKTQDNGPKGLLGVQTGESAKDSRAPWMQGVRIDEVIDGEAAQKIGLRVGERIAAVDGVEVSGGAQLRELVRSHAPGARIELRLQADKSVTLEARSKSDQPPAARAQAQGQAVPRVPPQTSPGGQARLWTPKPDAAAPHGDAPSGEPRTPGVWQVRPVPQPPATDRAPSPAKPRGNSAPLQTAPTTELQALLAEIRGLRREVAELRREIDSLSEQKR
jgi:predicted metalloprotease with PDZ domain